MKWMLFIRRRGTTIFYSAVFFPGGGRQELHPGRRLERTDDGQAGHKLLCNKIWRSVRDHCPRALVEHEKLGFASSANPSGEGNSGRIAGIGERIHSQADLVIAADELCARFSLMRVNTPDMNKE
jgi:hypothetical protein